MRSKIIFLVLMLGALATQGIKHLDQGLLFQFVSLDLSDGSKVNGQVIGVYNERPFMWHPKHRDSLALFRCDHPLLGLKSFHTNPSSGNAVWSVNTDEIVSIQIVEPPPNATTYRHYLRDHDVTIHHQPIQEQDMYILTDWTGYHTWEDGRSNYAWDLAALNSNMMTYQNLGQALTDFQVFGLRLHLPLDGVIHQIIRTEMDQRPDLIAAIEFQELENGNQADLEEKVNNGIEVTPGGPFLLRMLHQKHNTVPLELNVGDFVEGSTYVGQVGNSGTTYTPHVHLVFGFFDQHQRYWSVPIEWKSYYKRTLLPYPTGYEYSDYKFYQFGYPKVGQLVTMST